MWRESIIIKKALDDDNIADKISKIISGELPKNTEIKIDNRFYRLEEVKPKVKNNCSHCKGQGWVTYQKEVPCGFCTAHEMSFKPCPKCNDK